MRYKNLILIVLVSISIFSKLSLFAQCVANTENRFAASWHSDLYIAANANSSTNSLYAWGASMHTYVGVPGDGGTGSVDVYSPKLVSTTSYNGTPLEVRASSPTTGASPTNVFGLRTNTNMYIFGDAISSITSWSGFGGLADSTVGSDITSKLPVQVSDIASFRISTGAIALVTKSAGNVYVLTKLLTPNVFGDSSSTEIVTAKTASATSISIIPTSVTTSTVFNISSTINLNIGDSITLVNGTSHIYGRVNSYNSGSLTINAYASNKTGSTALTSWTLSYASSSLGSYWHKVLLSDGLTPLSGVTKFSLSYNGALALTTSGKIYYWGAANPFDGNIYGYAHDVSSRIPNGVSVTDVLVAGATHSNLFLLCSDTYVYGAGTNDNGILAQNDSTFTNTYSSFVKVKKRSDVSSSSLNNIVKIDADNNGKLNIVGVMNSTGQIFAWGDNKGGSSFPMLGATNSSGNDIGATQIFTSATGNYNLVPSGTATSTAAPGTGYTDFGIGGHFVAAFYTSGSTTQYWYLGHNTNGSIGYNPTSVIQGSNTFNPGANILYPTYLDALPLITFACSNTQPTIITTGTLSAFSACTGIASSNQTITVSGQYLSANITVSAPTGYEVSTSSGSGFGATATLTQSGGTVNATTIYIRLSSSAITGASGNISCTSIGATEQDIATGTATVNSLPNVTSVSGASRSGTGTVTLSGTASSGATLDWYAASTGGSVLSGGTAVLSFTTPSISTTTNYFAGARNTTTGCLSSSRTIVTATINGSFYAGSISTSQTSICYGTTPSAMSSIADASGGTGSISYQWKSSTDNITFSNISGATSSTYTPLSTLTQTTYYERAATTFTDGTIYSNVITVTVNALPTASAAVGNSRTGAGPVIISASASAGATLDWYAASTGGSVLSGGNGVTTFTTPSISQTTTYFAQARDNTTGCISTSRLAVLATINGVFSPGSIAADQIICSGTTPFGLTSITDAGGGTGTITYQWKSSLSNFVSDSTTISGANASTYSPSALSATTYFKRNATTTADGTVYSNIVTITVNPLPTITLSSVSSINTNSTSFSLPYTAKTGSPNLYSITTGSPTVMSGFSPVNNASLGSSPISVSVPTSSAGTYNFNLVVTNSTTTCASNSTGFTVQVVNPPPAITVVGSLTAFTACSGTVSSEQSFTVSGSNLTNDIILTAPTGYEISTTSGSSFSGNITLTQVGGSISSTTIYVRLKNNASNAASGNIAFTSTGATTQNLATGSATVNALPSITSQPSNSTVCSGTSTSFSVSATGTGLTYQWQVSTDGGTSFNNVTNTGIYGGSTSATLSLSSSLTTTYNNYQYKCIVSGTCSPNATSNTATLTVNALPAITSQPSNSTVCSGSSTSFSISATGAGLTYLWQVSTDGGTSFNNVTNTGIYSGSTSATLSLSSSLTSTYNNYQFKCIVSGTCSPILTSNTATLTVNDVPTITLSSISSINTNSTSFNLPYTATTGSPNLYSITTGSPTAMSGYSPVNNASLGSSPISVSVPTISAGTYNFNLVVTNSTTTCVSNSTPFSVDVVSSSSPNISITGSLRSFEACNGANSAEQSISVSGTNLTSDITVNAPSGYEISATSGGTFTSNITITQLSGTVNSTTIYIRLTNSATNGASGNISFQSSGATTQNVSTGSAAISSASVSGSISGSATVCSGTNSSLLTLSGNTGSIQWQVSTDNINYSNISGVTSSTYTASNLSITSYYRAIVTSGSCSSINASSVTVTVNSTPSAPVIGTLTQPTCTTSTGSVILSGLPASGSWTVTESIGSTTITGTGTTGSFSGLSSGTYTFTVSSSTGCTSVSSTSATINTQPATPTAAINTPSATELTCSTTSISLTATGGGTYSWSDGTSVVGNTATISVSSPATYTVTVTNANGCTATASQAITQNITAPTAAINTPSATELTCSTTSISLTATGGGTYSWSDGTSVVGNTATISVTNPATYTVTVISANGCTATASQAITQNITAPTAAINTPSATELTCSTTSISLTATGGGSYSWSDGINNVGNTATIIVTNPATYTVTVKSANGCTASASQTITQNSTTPTAAINTPTATELTCSTTSISLTATGGGTYSWSNGTSVVSNTATISVSSPATYTVTVTSANGCTATASQTITQNSTASTAAINTPTTTVLTASITSIDLLATGGGIYSWTNGNISLGNNASLQVSSAGTYKVTVTSPNGCTSNASIVITQNSIVPDAMIEAPNSVLNCTTTSLQLIAKGAGTYSWSDGSRNLGTSSTLHVTEPGIYILTVTNSFGNVATASKTITQDISLPNASITSLSTAELNCTTTSINILASGGNTYQWTDGINQLGTDAQLSVETAAVYTVTVTGINGCSATASQTITQDITKPLAGILTPVTTELSTTVKSISLAAYGSGNFSWTDGSNQVGVDSILIVSKTGNYSVKVTGLNGCSTNSNVLTIRPAAPITAPATFFINATTNPTNISSQVTGLKDATLIFYNSQSGGNIIPVPTLPTVPGVYTYYVCQVLNNIKSVIVPVTIKIMDPIKVIDIEKSIVKLPELQSDGSYIVGFSIKLKNYTNALLDSVMVTDNLVNVFGMNIPFQVINLTSSGFLFVNNLYDGNLIQDLLIPESKITSLEKDSIQLTVKFFPKGFVGDLTNTAKMITKSMYGVVSEFSNDPLISNGNSNRVATRFNVPVVEFSIPSGFSPNRDGVNDYFVITKPFNTTIQLEVYNRWGNLVYQNQNYNNNWDGKGYRPADILGDELPDGTYYYVVIATNNFNRTQKRLAGFVVLKR